MDESNVQDNSLTKDEEKSSSQSSKEPKGIIAKIKDIFAVRELVKQYEEKLNEAVEELRDVRAENLKIKEDIHNLKEKNIALYQELETKKDEYN